MCLLLFFLFHFCFIILLDFIEIEIDLLTFEVSFDGSFSNLSDKKPKLNIKIIPNFYRMRLSVPPKSDTNKLDIYTMGVDQYFFFQHIHTKF